MTSPFPEAHSIAEVITPIAVALVFITLMSLVKEPMRRSLMAIIVAGAGATYISGGAMGVWEFPFTTVMAVFSYRGLASYRFTGFAWLLHTAWDVAHHATGHPIIPFYATSSLGCAICDPVIALWCFAGAPPVISWFRKRAVVPVP
jgi:Family of unknown function (DUF6010)